MRTLLCLGMTALAISALTAPALADVIAEPSISGAAGLGTVALLLTVLLLVTLCILKYGGKRK